MRRAWWVLAIAGWVGCVVGQPLANPNGVTLRGTVRDFATGAELGMTNVAMLERSPTFSTTANADGFYQIEGLPRGALLDAIVTRPNYRQSRTAWISLDSTMITMDLEVIALAEVDRLYQSVGRTATSGTAIVIVTLVTPAGQPAESVAVTGIRLRTIGDTSRIGIGPFVLDQNRNLVPADSIARTVAVNGRARVAILDVPPGLYSLSSFGSFRSTIAKTSADGATLATLKQ